MQRKAAVKLTTEINPQAAEAAFMLWTGKNNGKFMDRTCSPDNNVNVYTTIGGTTMSSPFSEDMDDDSMKKNWNVLKKFRVLWKKGQK
ncbi:Interactor of constitutive active ROPs 3 [Linum perenne]